MKIIRYVLYIALMLFAFYCMIRSMTYIDEFVKRTTKN